jgi:general secretion pathway protein M
MSNVVNRNESIFARLPFASALLYFALIVLFVFATFDTVVDLMARRNAVAAATETLAQIEGRTPARRGQPRGSAEVAVPAGSPFVEGATVSVAGAALLQRVAAATTQVGGNILSSQVDLQGSQSKAGFVTVTANFEVEQGALQQLLYDLEAGMPFVFVDQMVVQAPSRLTNSQGAKLRVVLTVSGQWRGAI